MDSKAKPTNEWRIDEEMLELLKEEHGTIYHLINSNSQYGYHIEFVCKHPPYAEFQRFKKDLKDKRKEDLAPENLFNAVCIFPEAKDLDEIAGRYPGAIMTASGELLKILGFNEEVSGKKYGNG